MSKISKIKKFLPYILLFAAIIVGVLGPLGAKVSYATSWWDLFTDPRIAILTLAGHAANIGLTVFSYVVKISANFLQFSVNESINHMEDYTSMVQPGWAITRDIANLFFIFILLYISIATILQLSGYGTKELLTKVIIIALLVNFSLMITNVIIDSSNILAVEFFNKVTKIKWEQTDASGEVTATTTTDMAGAIVGGMKLQSLFQAIDVFSKKTEECTLTTAEVRKNVAGGEYCFGTAKRCSGDVNNDTIDDSKYCCNCTIVKEETLNTPQVLIRIFIVGVGGIIFELVTAFVLFAAGCLFVTRLAILLILMILAPLAFLAMALPKTQPYAKQWWDKLFNQAFFAPAYLFLFYLTIKIVAEGNLIDKLGASQTSLAASFADPDTKNVSIILNFVIVIILMFACLIIAKQMGAYGASTVQSWGKSAQKWGQAKAGKISRKGAGWAAEKAMDKESKINQWTGGRMAAFSKLPIIGRGFAKVSSLREKENIKQKKEWEKQYGGYSEAGLNAMLRSPMSGARKEAILGALNKKISERKNKKWYDDNKDRDFDKEIEGHKKGLAGVEASISSSSYVDEKQKFEAQKKIITEKIKEAERDKKTMEEIKGEKNLEKILEEKIKKIKESESPAKPAPASTPKT